MEVPDRTAVLCDPVLFEYLHHDQRMRELTFALAIPALMMTSPGAKISTHGPQLEKYARSSRMLVAPTVTAVGSRAGLCPQASALLLPAETYE